MKKARHRNGTGLPTRVTVNRLAYVSSDRMEGKKFFTGFVVLIFCGSGAGAAGAGGRTMDLGEGATGRASLVTTDDFVSC